MNAMYMRVVYVELAKYAPEMSCRNAFAMKKQMSRFRRMFRRSQQGDTVVSRGTMLVARLFQGFCCRPSHGMPEQADFTSNLVALERHSRLVSCEGRLILQYLWERGR